MNTGFLNSRCAGFFQATLVSALLLMPLVSQAQVFFASGGSTNAAASTPNLAFGAFALNSNTTGANNVAIGLNALTFNTTGSQNTANGTGALTFNDTGSNNTAIGAFALNSNTTGSNNTANGRNALVFNTTGSANTAYGFNALFNNTTGINNTANGYQALFNNTTAFNNIANGFQALFSNTTGTDNTANGALTLFNNASGSANTANGFAALFNNTQGYFNIALGYGAGQNLTTGNNIAIGNPGVAAESQAIRIGTTGTHTSAYIAGINGITASGGVAVFINANGQLGTVTSSRRFKSAIKDMGSASDRLMQLRPVTFRYKQAAEKGTHPLQYGLIAEEVAKVYPDLVQYDKAGKPFTIYYHLLTPMLLNELQKERRQNEAMKAADKAEIAALKSEMALLKQSQQQQLNALAKLTTLVETSQNKAQVQRAAFVKH